MKTLSTKVITGLAATLSLFSCAPAPRETTPPNIIIILADDMGFSDLHCYGSEINTPNLDSLASGGMLFTRFTNAGRCCPSRASMLTGLYPHQAGMAAMADVHYDTDAYQGYLSNKAVTLAEMLKLKGYNTYFSGKWHVGDKAPQIPSERGFDRSFAFLNGATSYYNLEPYRDSSWLEITGSIALKMLYDGKDYLPPLRAITPPMLSPTMPSISSNPAVTTANRFSSSLPTMRPTGRFMPPMRTLQSTKAYTIPDGTASGNNASGSRKNWGSSQPLPSWPEGSQVSPPGIPSHRKRKPSTAGR